MFDEKRINKETLKDILKSSKFQYVNLILNDTDIDLNQTDYIDGLKDDMLIWMGNAVSLDLTLSLSLQFLSIYNLELHL